MRPAPDPVSEGAPGSTREARSNVPAAKPDCPHNTARTQTVDVGRNLENPEACMPASLERAFRALFRFLLRVCASGCLRGCLESGDSVWAPNVETPRGASPGRRGRSQVPRRARGTSERARARSPPQRRPTGRLYSGGTLSRHPLRAEDKVQTIITPPTPLKEAA